MLSLSLSILVLLVSWIMAHMFAVPIAHFIQHMHIDRHLKFNIFKPQVGTKRISLLRKFFFAVILIALDLILAAVLGIQPIFTLWKGYVQNFMDFELTQNLMKGLLDNLILALGVYGIYQTILFINEFFPRLLEAITRWRHTRFHVLRIKSIELFTPDQIAEVFISLARFIQIGLNLVLAVIGLAFTLSFFPSTQDIVYILIEKFLAIVKIMGQAALDFLPNLFALLFIGIITRYTLKLLKFFYEGIQHNRIKIPGLHLELAEPTYQLLRFFLLALALVAAYPYLPGSDSPVFRGITIFVGFLISLGSTSLVTNIVSGVVLTYTRGLRIGDRVKIGETIGDVAERNLLVTRIRTIKNVIVTIPNGMVLNNQIINFSAPVSAEGLILHTTVTIGYDIPWRTVRDLLTKAAHDTKDIRSNPAPFVLQTSLDDYYVSYELNAYTQFPERMAKTYSDLHANIQDRFNHAGIEILSPAYTAYRDGGELTIPADQPEQKNIPVMLTKSYNQIDTQPVGKK